MLHEVDLGPEGPILGGENAPRWTVRKAALGNRIARVLHLCSLASLTWALLVLVASGRPLLAVYAFGLIVGAHVTWSLLQGHPVLWFTVASFFFSGPFLLRGVFRLQSGDALPEPAVQTLKLGALALAAVCLGAGIGTLTENQLPRRISDAYRGRFNPFLAWLLFYGLVVSRLFGGLFLNIGRPGLAPAQVPFVGAIFALTTYGPLACLAVLARFGRATTSVLLGAAVYGAVGAALGWRSYVFSSALVVLFTLGDWTVDGTKHGKKKKRLLATIVFVAAGTTSLLWAVSERTDEQQSASASASFLVDRVGGFDYAYPAIAAVDASGGPRELLRNEYQFAYYLKVEVYNLPYWARTAFAASGVGSVYAGRGSPGVFVFHFFAGVFGWLGSFLIDTRTLGVPYLRVATGIGIINAVFNFLLEGTIGPSLRMLIASLVVGVGIEVVFKA